MSQELDNSSIQSSQLREQVHNYADTRIEPSIDSKPGNTGKPELIDEFSLEAIWAEMERIKQQRAKVDSTYQKIMRQLKSPDPTSSKQALRNAKSVTTFGNQNSTTASPIRHLRQAQATDHSKSVGRIDKRDAATSVSNYKQKQYLSPEQRSSLYRSNTRQTSEKSSLLKVFHPGD